jgi:hypothetical protein
LTDPSKFRNFSKEFPILTLMGEVLTKIPDFRVNVGTEIDGKFPKNQ